MSMKLISCDTCGVVLDRNKLKFPNIYDDVDYYVKSELAVWDDEQFKAITKCPVCKGDIMEEN